MTLSEVYDLPSSIRRKFIELTVEDIKRMHGMGDPSSTTSPPMPPLGGRQPTQHDTNAGVGDYLRRKAVIDQALQAINSQKKT